jgi:hypothetical protein
MEIWEPTPPRTLWTPLGLLQDLPFYLCSVYCEEEIKERIAAGNRGYNSHKKLFTSKLISRNVKLQLYNILIRPIVTCASETWVLKENLINKLMIFERKIM